MKNSHLILTVTAATLLATARLPAADVTATWNGTGNWSSPARWSSAPLFPNNGNGGLTFDVVQSTGTSTLDQNIAIQKYTLSGGTNEGGGFNLTINESFTWGGAGTLYLTGTGTIQASGGISLGAGARQINGGRTLNLGGASTWSAGGLSFQTGTGNSVNVLAGATFDNSFDASLNGGSNGSFNVAGTFTKSAGAGTTAFNTVFNNTGAVNVDSGTLRLSGGGTHTGSFAVAAGTTLDFNQSTHSLNAGTSITGLGTVSFSGNSGSTTFNAGTYNVAGLTSISGTANFNAAATTSLLTISGTLGGSGTVTVSGLTTWTAGTSRLTGAGTLQANGGMAISGSNKEINNGRTLNLGGASTWNSGLLVFQTGSGNSVNVLAGATFDNSFDGTFSGGANGAFNNAGTFTKSAGTGSTTFSTAFNNTGTVNVDSGTLSLNGGVPQHSGTTLTGGTWNIGATLAITTGSNITTNGAASSVTLDGAGSAFSRFTTALNNNQGSFTLRDDRDLATAGALANSGSLTVEDAATVLTVNGAYTQSAGTTTLLGGATLAATTFNLNGGSLLGSGTVSGHLISDGLIAPGASPGLLSVTGNLSLLDDSTISLEIGGLLAGTDYDQLSIGGTALLDGEIDLSFIDDFSPASGDSFTLITADSFSGFFENATPVIGNTAHIVFSGGEGDLIYGADSLVLTNVVAAVPEAGSAIFGLVVLTLAGSRRRRMRRA